MQAWTGLLTAVVSAEVGQKAAFTEKRAGGMSEDSGCGPRLPRGKSNFVPKGVRGINFECPGHETALNDTEHGCPLPWAGAQVQLHEVQEKASGPWGP